jgi:hypothetical protein
MMSMDAMSAAIAHEIRQPLGAIAANASALSVSPGKPHGSVFRVVLPRAHSRQRTLPSNLTLSS